MTSGIEFEGDAQYSRPASPASAPAPTPGASSGVTIESGPGAVQGHWRPPVARAGGSGMAGWLVEHGIAKSETAAHLILIGLVVLNIVVTFVIVRFFLF